MTRWGLGTALTAVLALAGCGSSGHHAAASGSASAGASGSASSTGEASKPPVRILTDAAAALRSARGYVLDGQISQSGGDERVRVVTNPGSLEVALAGAGGRLEAIVLPTGTYVKLDQAFLNAHGGGHGGLLANRWLQIPPASAQSLASQLGQFRPETTARCLAENHGRLSLAGTTTIAGQPAVVIKDSGNVPGGAPGTLAVAASGPPYPLQAVATGPGRPGGRIDVCNDGKAQNTRGRLTFSHFGRPPQITAPPNPVQLGQRGGAI